MSKSKIVVLGKNVDGWSVSHIIESQKFNMNFKETILRILRKELKIKFDKATWAEWIKVEETHNLEDNKFWAMLPTKIDLGKIADKILEAID